MIGSLENLAARLRSPLSRVRRILLLILATSCLALAAPSSVEAQFTSRDSALFENLYEGDAHPVPDHTGAPSGSTGSSDGEILTLDFSATGGDVVLESDIWPNVADDAQGWTAEWRLKFTPEFPAANPADAMFQMRIGDAENAGPNGQQILRFFPDRITTASGTVLSEGADMTDDFSVFRVAQLPGDNDFHLWLDGTKLPIVGASFTGGQNMWWGSGSSIVKSIVEVDYFRFTGEGGFSPVIPPELLRKEWILDGTGRWEESANWDQPPFPLDNTNTAIFGDGITSSSTVLLSSNLTAKALEFDNANNSYAIAGLGTLTLEADTGNATIDVFNSPSAGHQLQLEIVLGDDTEVDAASGTLLEFNNTLNLNGNTLTIGGAGQVSINNDVIAGSGGTIVNTGNLSAVGTIESDLVNTPDGILTAGGLTIHGVAELAGAVDVSALSGLSPAPGGTFTVLTATGGIIDNGLSLTGAGGFVHTISGNNLVVTAVPEPTAALLMFACCLSCICGRWTRLASSCKTSLATPKTSSLAIAICSVLFYSHSALAQFATRDSALFENNYEGDAFPVPDHTIAFGAVIGSSDGSILTLDQTTSGGKGVLLSDDWAAVADDAGGWTVEYRIKVTPEFPAADPADRQFQLRVGDAENTEVNDQQVFSFFPDRLTTTGGLALTDADMTADFRVFRVAQLPGDNVFHTWLDGVKLPNTLGSFSGGENAWFGAGSSSLVKGTAEVDYVRFTGNGGFAPNLPGASTRKEWNSTFSDRWDEPANWDILATPDDNMDTAVFGGVAVGSTTVAVDSGFTVKGLEFDNSEDSYAIAGLGSVTLEANIGNASIDVLASPAAGHELQAATVLADNTDITTSTGSLLQFDNLLDLNGNTLAISGSGQVNINSDKLSGTVGTVDNSGVLGGVGTINGTLTNNGTLAYSIAGTGTLDSEGLTVTGTASLGGTLEIALDNFTPTEGDTFTVLVASNIADTGLTLGGQSQGFSYRIVGGNRLELSFSEGTPGDFNGDGAVDSADYAVWLAALGATEDGSILSGNGNGGLVDISDYNLWKGNLGNGDGSSTRSASSIPEPTALLHLAVCLSVLLAFRRCRSARCA